MLLNVSDEQGFKIRELQHVLEGYKVAKEIAAHGVGGGTFIDWWGFKAEAYDAIPYNVALMDRAGVLTSVNSDSDELARRLNQDAAKAMKYGGLVRGGGAEALHAQRREAAPPRSPHRLDRRRQGRRSRHLERPSVLDLLARRDDASSKARSSSTAQKDLASAQRWRRRRRIA